MPVPTRSIEQSAGIMIVFDLKVSTGSAAPWPASIHVGANKFEGA